MRTADEILEDAKRDIITTGEGVPKALWLEYRKLEVLIDIRDIFHSIDVRLTEIANTLHKP